MIKINLLPKEVSAKAAAKEKTLLFGGIIVLLVIIIFAGLGMQRMKMRKLKAYTKELNQKIADLKPVVDKVAQIRQEEDRLKKELDLIQSLTKYRIVYPKLMETLTARLPANIWLTNFVTKCEGESGSPAKMEIRLSGTSFSNFAIADFIYALEKIPGTAEVELGQISESSTEGGKKALVFTISCKYTSPG